MEAKDILREDYESENRFAPPRDPDEVARSVQHYSNFLSENLSDAETETEALKELNDFLSKPRSIGLDNLKESLRNVVELWLEVKGYSTGRDLQHLVHGEHSTLAIAGTLPQDRERKKREELARALAELEHMMRVYFEQAYEAVQERIHVIKTGIDLEIEAIDRAIEEEADTEAEAEEMKKKSSKRRKLKRFKQHIKEHEAELEDANTTKEIIELEKNIVEDMQDFKAGRFNPEAPPPRPDPLFPISKAMDKIALTPLLASPTNVQSNVQNNEAEPKVPDLPEHYSFENQKPVGANRKTDDSASGKGDASGTGDTDSSGGTGDREEDTSPPLPSIDL